MFSLKVRQAKAADLGFEIQNFVLSFLCKVCLASRNNLSGICSAGDRLAASRYPVPAASFTLILPSMRWFQVKPYLLCRENLSRLSAKLDDIEKKYNLNKQTASN